MSWKPEVQTDNTGKWYGNALRFATKEEAEKSVSDLASRWWLVTGTRTVECDDPVNYRWDDAVGLVRVFDFEVRDEGTIFLLTPKSDRAREWAKNWITPDRQTFGDAIVVEHRYIGQIVEGIRGDGLTVEGSS